MAKVTFKQWWTLFRAEGRKSSTSLTVIAVIIIFTSGILFGDWKTQTLTQNISVAFYMLLALFALWLASPETTDTDDSEAE